VIVLVAGRLGATDDPRICLVPGRQVYPVILIDAIVVKIRDGQVANRPIYVAMGVTIDGERDVLGMWVGPTGGRAPRFWMTALTELRNRGITDTFIVCWPQRAARVDPRHLAAGRRPDVRRPPGAFSGPLHVEEALGAGLPGDARDLHGPHRRSR
jgi:Transposase, Mutator family